MSLLFCWSVSAAPLRLRNARVWDGTGAPAREGQWIAIDGGRVSAVGDEPAPPSDHAELDVHGRTVIPGLIDAHVHLEAVPGAALRGDSAAQRAAAQEQALRAYVACGVTTVLDAGISWPALARVRGWLADGTVGPRVLTLGPVLGPEGGYVEAFLPEHVGADAMPEVEEHLDRLVEAGALGLKLTIEPGYILPVLPLHEPAFRAEIAAQAAARGLPVLVHAQHADAHEAALDLQPRAVLHMVRDRRAPTDLIARYAAQQTWLVSTLNIDAAPLVAKEPAPWVRALEQKVIPADQRETALSRKGWRDFRRGMAAVALPEMAPWLRRLGLALSPVRAMLRRGAARTGSNLRRMHEGGVRIALGSDAGAYDTIPFYFHGVSTLQEVRWAVQAGLSPAAALHAATGQAAELLGIAGEAGTITVGAAADLVILDADPLADPEALYQVHQVVQAGVPRTPDQILSGTPD